MNKYYFSEHDPEYCHNLSYFYEYMEENEISELELFEAKRITNIEWFYCKKYEAPGEKGSCGIICESYIPNNGKNGRCKYYGYCYEIIGKKKIIKL